MQDVRLSEGVNTPLIPPAHEILKQILAQKNINAAELGRRTGVSMASISRLLAGKTQPTFETMAKLAQALEISLDMLAPGPKAAPRPDHSTVFATYALEHTDLSPAEGARLLAQGANGSWVAGPLDFLAHPNTPAAEMVSAAQMGTRRLEITLAFPHELVESGSVVGLLSVVGSALTGTGARLLDISIPPSLWRTFPGPSFGLTGVRDLFNKHGRPLLCGTLRPMAGLTPKLYGRGAFEALTGGADFTADPTLMHNLPSNGWRERARFTAEAALASARETNEFKAHLFNITAPTVAEMEERATWARDLDMTMVLVDAAAVGWAGLQSIAKFCAKSDLALATMGGRALFGDMLSEQLQAKLLRFIGADIVSTGSPLRGNTANRRYVQGVLAALRDEATPVAPEGGQYLEQGFGGLPAALPAIGGGHNPWHFPRLFDAIGSHTIIQCGGSMFGHPQGAHDGATACRTALEALVQARAEGQNMAVEGRNILARAAKFSPELRVALEHFQEGSFLFGVVQGQRPTGATVLPHSSHPSPALVPSSGSVLTPFRRPDDKDTNTENDSTPDDDGPQLA